jgi:hypothetical protein
MGRKSSAKEHRTSAADHSSGGGKKGPIFVGALVAAVIVVGIIAMWGGNGSADSAAAGAAAPSSSAAPQNAATNPPDPKEVAQNEPAAQQRAAVGPHKQANLPPIPVRNYAPPRPMQTVTAAFHFAAEHPEILSYVPCFCGCQHMGHRGNDECFVKSRDKNGDVVAWEEHGIDCAVCIDIATKARQMYSSGASVTDIRAAIEKEYAPNFPSMTATPKPHTSH